MKLSDGWQEMSLGEFCEIYQPKTISRKQMIEDGEYPVFGANGVIGRHNEYNHENSELLITCRGATCGSVNVSLPKSWVNGNAMVVRPDETLVLRQYLEYAFQGPIDLSSVITGSAQPQITRTNLSPVRFAFPSLSNQERIVSVLDEAFENISVVLEQSIKELNHSTSLFESLLDRTFGQTTKDENGVIMPLWPTQILSDVCEKITDGAHNSPKKLYNETSPGLHPYVTSKNIRMGHLKLDTLQYCNSEFHSKIYARCNPELGDVLLTKDGANTGNVTINSLHTPFSLLSSVCLIKTKTTKLLPNFLYYYIRSRHGSNQLSGKMTGTAIKRIILKTIKASEIPLPSIVEQKKTIEFLDRHCEEIEKLTSIYTSKVNYLNEMKQSILKEAFDGNLTKEITA